MLFANRFNLQPWSVSVLLAAGDATKSLKATPGAGKALVVTKWSYRSITSAAQAITIGDGTVTLDNLAASITVGNLVEGPLLDYGVKLTANTALSITPAAAGPSGRIIAEGYIVNA
jgi:hypothetical protein